jgi:hypothetical protein
MMGITAISGSRDRDRETYTGEALEIDSNLLSKCLEGARLLVVVITAS